MTEGTAATRAKNRYNAKNYDSLRIIVPKGHKSTIQEAASQAGESINGYVNKAILNRLELKEWPLLAEPPADE
ncbi:MAG: antitoxin [Christensenellales bacterium]|jgi:predicted HicB family RNase H-like nuclease